MDYDSHTFEKRRIFLYNLVLEGTYKVQIHPNNKDIFHFIGWLFVQSHGVDLNIWFSLKTVTGTTA